LKLLRMRSVHLGAHAWTTRNEHDSEPLLRPI
jgi:hypothetical protein